MLNVTLNYNIPWPMSFCLNDTTLLNPHYRISSNRSRGSKFEYHRARP